MRDTSPHISSIPAGTDKHPQTVALFASLYFEIEKSGKKFKKREETEVREEEDSGVTLLSSVWSPY